jgi:hypothetical protein
MVEAFILIQVEPGSVTSILDHLRSVVGVTETEMVTGPHDVIARVRAVHVGEFEQLTDLLKRIDGVLHVLASPVVAAGGAVP